MGNCHICGDNNCEEINEESTIYHYKCLNCGWWGVTDDYSS